MSGVNRFPAGSGWVAQVYISPACHALPWRERFDNRNRLERLPINLMALIAPGNFLDGEVFLAQIGVVQHFLRGPVEHDLAHIQDDCPVRQV